MYTISGAEFWPKMERFFNSLTVIEGVYSLCSKIFREHPMQRGRESSAARSIANVMALQGLEAFERRAPQAAPGIDEGPAERVGRNFRPHAAGLVRA